MSAPDLFAMLNAPLPGNGAGASASGQPDGETGGAFAGLLAMMAPQGDAAGETATAATTASVGMSLAPFRFNGPGAFVQSDDVSTAGAASEDSGEDSEDADGAGADEDPVVQAGLIGVAPPPMPTPTPAPQTITAQPATGAAPTAASPMASPETDPTSPAVSPEGEPLATGERANAASGRTETNAGFQIPAPQGAQTGSANQTPQTALAKPVSMPSAIPAPETTDAAPMSVTPG